MANTEIIKKIFTPIGIFILTAIFVSINAYPVWRFATFIENAIADPEPAISSSEQSVSHVSSSFSDSSAKESQDDEVIPDHSTLIGLWVGIVWGFICLASIGLPHFVSYKYPFLQNLCRWMSRIAYQILTTILWVNILLFIWEIINAVDPRAHGDSVHGGGAAISAIVFAVVSLLITFGHLFHALCLYTRHITIETPKVTKPFTLAHISDVHIGSRTSMWLSRVVKRINSEPCDAVVISGDLFDYPGVQNHEMDPIFGIKAPVFAVTGNHDLATSESTYRRLYAYMSSKVNLIDDTCAPVPGDSGAMLLGVEDYDDKEDYLNVVRQLSKDLDENPKRLNCYRILVNHRPWGFHHMVNEELADLLLSGHTHAGGQLLALIPAVKIAFPLFHGLYTIGGRHMFCSPGTGTWGPYVREWGLNLVTYIHITPVSDAVDGGCPQSPTTVAGVSEPLCPKTPDQNS